MNFGSESWLNGLADVISSLGNESFWPMIAALTDKIAPSDSLIVNNFTDNNRPATLFNNLKKERTGVNITQYEEGAYLLDPIYLACSSGIACGVYRLTDLAPDHFRRSEYYRTFYKLTGTVEEIGIVIPVQKGQYISLSIERVPGQKSFKQTEIADLRKTLPVVRNLVIAHVRKIGLSPPPSKDTVVLGHIELFGRQELTNREQQVARLILRGHSSHSVAQLLEISYETVKNHRKRMYAKLGISSQSELFQLFLENLPLVN